MPIRVSVIVAVYNTGEHIEPLIDSLTRQTMPPAEFEVVFVDDGSTDGTPARLDRLAALRPNVTVVHEPNSGWPGRPRNVGMDAARGEYFFFADHDDWFGVEALQRLTAYADAHAADITIGRYAGHHRGVAKALFTRDRPAATLAGDPLLDSLTPHKLFRGGFVREHGLRFPEGRRRLEDHVFVVEAYFRAQRISVLADYHCYFHIGRPDAGNAGFRPIDPASYYRYVREVVDIIVRNTEPGPLRDRCLRRPLRQELLGRLDGAAYLAADPQYQREVFDEARQLALDLIPAGADTGLSPPQRVRAALLRAGRFDDQLAYVRHQVGVVAAARLGDMRWDDSGALRLNVTAQLRNGKGGPPWTYRVVGGRTLLTVPVGVPEGVADVGPELSGAVQLVARRRADSEEWVVPTDSSTQLHADGNAVWASYRATARLDPRTVASGVPLTPGVWDLYVRVSQTGWSKEIRLGADRDEQVTARTALVGGTTMLPYWTQTYDNLSLDVAALVSVLRREIDDGVVCADVVSSVGRRTLQVVLPVAGAAPPSATLRLTRPAAQPVDLPTDAAFVDGALVLTAPLPRLRRGRWRILVALDVPGWGRPRPAGLAIRVSLTGITVTADDRVPDPAPEAGAAATKPAPRRSLKRRLRRRAGRVLRRAGLRRSPGAPPKPRTR